MAHNPINLLDPKDYEHASEGGEISILCLRPQESIQRAFFSMHSSAAVSVFKLAAYPSDNKVAATFHRCNQALVDAVKSGRVLLPRPPAAAHKGAQHSSGAFDSALFHGTGSRSTLRNAGCGLIRQQAPSTSFCSVCRELSEESKCEFRYFSFPR